MNDRTDTAVVLFSRDLRVHDNPALHAAAQQCAQVVPPFVLDKGILRGDYDRPNRAHFLARSLHDLDCALSDLGARLVVRRRDVEREVLDVVSLVGADVVHLAGDIGLYARRPRGPATPHCSAVARNSRSTRTRCSSCRPDGLCRMQHMSVFSPYFRRWQTQRRRDPLDPPRRLRMPVIDPGTLPEPEQICRANRPRRPRQALIPTLRCSRRTAPSASGPAEQSDRRGGSIAALTLLVGPPAHCSSPSVVDKPTCTTRGGVGLLVGEGGRDQDSGVFQLTVISLVTMSRCRRGSRTAQRSRP